MPRLRPRISLLVAFLLMTIIGMALAVVQLWREVAPLRADNRQLRQELGHLSIDDEDKIYAIQVVSDDPNTQRYRVHLPKDHTFKIFTRIHTIPGCPIKASRQEWLASLLKSRTGGSETIASGDFTIDVKLVPNTEQKNEWDLVYHVLGGSGVSRVGSDMPWLNDRRAWGQSGEASIAKQSVFDAAGGIVLFAIRQGTVTDNGAGSYSTTNADGIHDTPGVMLWIAPASAAN